MSEFLIPVLITAVLILLNGLFVAAEFAIVAAPKARIAQLAEEGSRAAQDVLSILRNPVHQNRYIATAQVGITVVSLGLGMYAEEVIAEWFVGLLHDLGPLTLPAAHTASTILAVGLLTYFHVVLGEMIPKTFALQFAEGAVLRLNRPMRLMGYVFRPVVLVLDTIGNTIVRLLGIPRVDTRARLFSPEELEFIVEESYEVGLIEPNEQLFIENIFDLHERTVGQIMTPRRRITALPVEANRDTVMRWVCEAHNSRFPIYEGDLDQIVGILHIKDLARHRKDDPAAWNLRELARPPVFVPESLTLEKLLQRFRAERLQIAIVIDEFGGTAGLVTIEDLMEEVVGEIQDEFDQEILPIEQIDARTLRVRGDLLLDELNQLYDLEIEIEEADTVGGLVMAILGRIPKPQDAVEVAGVRFEVESVDGLAVQTVIVRLPESSGSR